MKGYYRLAVLVTYSCPTLCNPMGYSPAGSSVHGIFLARILEWVAVPFTKGSFYILIGDKMLIVILLLE